MDSTSKQPKRNNNTNDNSKTEAVEQKKDLLKHELSFVNGFEDELGLGIDFDDYYNILGDYGFFNNKKIPKSPLTLSTNTTTAVHFYDKSLQKTPIDPRHDVIHPDLGLLAQQAKDGNSYNIQDFEALAAENIKLRTLRILSDPEEKLESELLSRMRARKRELLEKFSTIKPLNQLLEYNLMNININTMLLNRLAKMQFLMEKQLFFHEQKQKPKGKTFYAELNLAAGAQATKIDFRDESKNQNISTASTTYYYSFPRQNLMFLSVYVKSGTRVFLAPNEDDLATYIPLTESDGAYVYDGKPYFPVESLNIRADSDACVVKIIGLY
jgi:hypothetical protein